MSLIKFQVQGSSPNPYTVTFEKKEGNLNAFCTCPAGENGQACKHRIDILNGAIDGVVSNNQDDVSVVCSWIAGTDVGTCLIALENAEKELAKAQAKLKAAKKDLGQAFRS